MSNNTMTTSLTSDTAIGTADMLFNDGAMAAIERAAQMMAKAKSTVPDHLKGSPADCMAVIMQSAQWKMNPFAVAQKTFLVSGTLGYEAQLINAVINANAPVTGRLQFEWFGPWENVLGKFASRKNEKGKIYHVPNWDPKDEQGLGVKVWGTLKGEDSPRVLELLLVQAQVRNSTLWASDPKQQLAYLAIKRWARLYCPDVILGVYTPDELERAPERDMGDVEVVRSVDDLLKPATPIREVPQDESVAKGTIDATLAAFESINVTRDQICSRLGHDATEITKQELEDLRQVYINITRNGKPAGQYFDASNDGAIECAKLAISVEQLMEMLNDADSVESLNDIAELAGDIDDPDERGRIVEMIANRKLDFEQ